MTADWKAMDDWCVQQAQKLRSRAEQHVMSGGDLDDPVYRTMLGRHQAFMQMRSFIHGSIRTATSNGD